MCAELDHAWLTPDVHHHLMEALEANASGQQNCSILDQLYTSYISNHLRPPHFPLDLDSNRPFLRRLLSLLPLAHTLWHIDGGTDVKGSKIPWIGAPVLL